MWKGWKSFWTGYIIKSTVDKAIETTKDNAKTIQDEKGIRMEDANAATGKEVNEVVVDMKRDYWINGRSTIGAFINFSNTFEKVWYCFIDFLCKSILYENMALKNWMTQKNVKSVKRVWKCPASNSWINGLMHAS